MKDHWAHLGLSPFSVILIGYFLQTLDFILITPVFRNLVFDSGASIWSEQISAENRLPILMGLLGIHYLGQAASTNFLGALSDCLGRRKILLFMQALWAISFFICAASLLFPEIFLLFIGRFIGGCASSYRPLALAAISDLYPDFPSRLRSFGLFSVIDGATAGAFCITTAAILHPSLHFIGSPLFPFFLAGLISLLNLLFLWINLPETSLPQLKNQTFRQYKELFRRPQLKTIYLLFFLGLIPFASLAQLEGGLETQASQLFLSVSYLLFSASWAASSSLLMPKFIQKFTIRQILLWTFGIFLLVWLATPTLMAEKLYFPLLLIFCGFAIGMAWPIILTLISQLNPPQLQGKAQSFAHFIFSLCMLFGPYVMLFYLFKHLALLQYGMAALLLLAFVTLLFFHPRPEIAGPVGKEYD